MRTANILLTLAAIPVLLACGYLFLLALLSRGRPVPRYGEPRLFFDIVIPAHNEEAGIAATVRNLLGLDYPRELFRVVVVADNCSDETAARAAAAGASVLLRTDPERRGKGYALDYAFARSVAEGRAEAVVVIDADTAASPNLLCALAARIDSGASALQADYAVRNPGASWRTQLMAIALGMFHALRSRARERLGVSCGLRGNGMCFTSALLREVPHYAFSLVEDVEYGIRLGEAGRRVHYAAEAHVYGEMVSSARASMSQRRRWERGRLAMAWLHGARLLRLAFSRRDGLLLDLALDVLVPPLSTLVAAIGCGLLLSGAIAWRSGALPASLGAWSACAFFLAVYVARGWALSGTGARGLIALLCAPAFLIWKLSLLLRVPEHAPGEWIRTTRETIRR